MKKLFLTFLIVLGLASPSWAINLIAELPCRTDLVDTKGVVSTGAIERVSGGTYIKDGVMQTARGNRTNLVERSYEFDNAWWAKYRCSVSANVINDPDGNLLADGLISNTDNNDHSLVKVYTTLIDNTYYFASASFKSADKTFGSIIIKTKAGGYSNAYFDLTLGTVTSTVSTVATGISDEENGWYRCWILVDIESGGSNPVLYILPAESDGDRIFIGDGSTIDVYITSAQLEKLEGPSAPPGVELIADQVDRDFSGASDWTNTDIAAYDETGDLTITANAIGQFCTLAATEAPMTGYQAYILEFDVANIVATWTISDFDAGYEIGTISANGTNQQIVFSYADASSGGIRITSVANNSSMDFDNVSLKEITFPGPLSPGTYTPTSGATATIPAEARFQDFGLLVEPGEGTNYALHSRDLSNAAWVKTNCTGTKNQTGLDGVANSASLLTASANNATCLQTITLASTAKTFSVYIKRSVGSGTISMTDDNGANYTACASLSSTAFTRYDITRTQANPVIGFKIATDTDAIIVDCNQLEETAYCTTPIHTTTSPVTRTSEAGTAADNGVSWTTPQELKNILSDAEPGGAPTDSQGTLLFEVKWGCDESAFAGDRGFIVVTNSIYSLAYFNTTSLVAWDGTASTSIGNPAFSAGDEITYSVRWGDVDGNADDTSAGLREAEGTWAFDATPAAYDGAFTLGTKIRLAYSNIYPFEIRNIQFWDLAASRDALSQGIGEQVLYHSLNEDLVQSLSESLIGN